MQLGKALVGAIIGAALGIGLLVIVHRWADGVWLAIPVALLTGLGARVMVAKGHPSYLRGAVTGVLALVAYMSGSFLVAEIAQRRAAVPVQRDVAAVAPERPAGVNVNDEPIEENAAAEMPVLKPAPEQPMAHNRGIAHMPKQQFAPLDFIWLVVAALLAYELGRGTGAPAAGAPSDSEETSADPSLARDEEPTPTPPEVVRPPD